MTQYGQYGSLDGAGASSCLPVWTSPSPGILEPLRLPSPPAPVSRFTSDPEVECLFCSEVFPQPEKHQEFLKHLLTDHKFVIGDVNLIANFPAYVKYWRNKFRTNSPDKFCTTMRAAVQLGEIRFTLCWPGYSDCCVEAVRRARRESSCSCLTCWPRTRS